MFLFLIISQTQEEERRRAMAAMARRSQYHYPSHYPHTNYIHSQTTKHKNSSKDDLPTCCVIM